MIFAVVVDPPPRLKVHPARGDVGPLAREGSDSAARQSGTPGVRQARAGPAAGPARAPDPEHCQTFRSGRRVAEKPAFAERVEEFEDILAGTALVYVVGLCDGFSQLFWRP